MLLTQFLILAAVLFCIGVYGVLVRRNGVLVLMSVELMLNAVNLNLIAFSAYLRNTAGDVFALFVIVLAAAEAAVGLAIVLAAPTLPALSARWRYLLVVPCAALAVMPYGPPVTVAVAMVPALASVTLDTVSPRSRPVDVNSVPVNDAATP